MERKTSRIWAVACAGLWLGGGAAFALLDAPDVDLLRQQHALKADLEGKIQSNILDPILGKDRAKSFVDVDLEYMSEREDKVKTGAGMAEKYKEKPGAKGGTGFPEDFILPGVPRPKVINKAGNQPPEKPAAAQSQMAAQEQEKKEQVFALKANVKSLLVTVIHDDTLAKAKLDMARSRIVDALAEYKATPEQIVFRAAHFDFGSHKWTDDLKNPNVYLPLLYALLLLLLLIFLFGPLARFMRRYIDALKEKPAAEVNVESKIEQPDEEEDDLGGPDEGKLDIMLGRKPPEPPPKTEEEDEMKKFEPFSYITEENLKRLANLFLLRREEPWLIAVVLSYLRPEFARQVLTSLPIELQAKVAMEALMVRQVTREQVVAIDAEVKENIEFVVGGIKRLTNMLDEADSQTRQNILETLKNEKPLVYEKVRKMILLFEDVVNFPDRDMQLIVRETKTESMARALQGASPEIVDKFFSNMSPGAVSLLKESMEYLKGLTAIQIEEERSKIIDHVKTMEKEGKISIRESAKEGGPEGFQEELAVDREGRYGGAGRKGSEAAPASAGVPGAKAEANPAAAAQDPQLAQQYFQAGLQSMQGGAMDPAIQYLQQAVELDASLWQACQYLGGILYQLGRIPEAMVYYEKVLEFNPDPQLKSLVDSYKTQVR